MKKNGFYGYVYDFSVIMMLFDHNLLMSTKMLISKSQVGSKYVIF